MKKIITTIATALSLLMFSQHSGKVGINTTEPTATLDVKGDLRVRNIPNGMLTDSIVVTNNGFIRKIALSDLIVQQTTICPTFLKSQSNPYYLLFSSASSNPNPNNALVIEGLNFTSTGNWIDNNIYYFSYTNTSGSPLNINNFTVIFGNKHCLYN